MHREILGLRPGDGKITDHKNHNGLDNHESNIRLCTNQQNTQNKKPYVFSKSGYKGVYWYKKVRKWQVHIRVNGTLLHLGYFNKEEDAARTYDKKAKELFGEFACTNFP